MAVLDDCSVLELRIGFDVGLYDRGDVASWVERAILAAESPGDVLLELATLSHRTSTEIADLLARLEVRSHQDTSELYIKTVAMMFRDKRLSAVASLEVLLGQVSFDGTQAQDEVFELHERMDSATRGIYGSVTRVEEDVAEFFAEVLKK